MRGLISGTVLAALAVIGSTQLQAGETMKTELKPYNVTILVFDPTKGMESGQDYVLPVDSPDVEHAIASTTANAASFTKKADGGKALPVAFTCIKVEAR
ncbi:hypothetical protein MKK84_21550 [Methylobacterium sp. E-065]|uniref:hypothetical protein n=1 Tax=Methylobacterium sp. E-065 TaxID=2836583 RepID=UPI001FBA22A2|nr:hypothetical protein [Methylobacterium sp. E-065]MCJ2019984.1 hypothetical protein [Methylobacterium sp. E-065]